jgi:hypothetical protein
MEQATTQQVPIPTHEEPPLLPMQYRRDIRIANVVLSQGDLEELFLVIASRTKDAISLQVQSENPTLFENEEQIVREVTNCMRISHVVRDTKANSITGYDVPDLQGHDFPDDIQSIFISTRETFQAIATRSPRNYVEAFISFVRTPVALNFIYMPSNPTENGSIINVYGYNEGWVVSTFQKLKEFIEKKMGQRSLVHKSGVYDLFLYLIVLPPVLWLVYRIERSFPAIFDDIPRSAVIAIYVYTLLLVLVGARLLFQYLRWLFPLVEYVPRRSLGPQAHRKILWLLLSGLAIAFLYDVARFFVLQ